MEMDPTRATHRESDLMKSRIESSEHLSSLKVAYNHDDDRDDDHDYHHDHNYHHDHDAIMMTQYRIESSENLSSLAF